MNTRSRFATTARPRMVPVAASAILSMSHRARVRMAVLVREAGAHRVAHPRFRPARGVAEEVLLVAFEVHVHRFCETTVVSTCVSAGCFRSPSGRRPRDGQRTSVNCRSGRGGTAFGSANAGVALRRRGADLELFARDGLGVDQRPRGVMVPRAVRPSRAAGWQQPGRAALYRRGSTTNSRSPLRTSWPS